MVCNKGLATQVLPLAVTIMSHKFITATTMFYWMRMFLEFCSSVLHGEDTLWFVKRMFDSVTEFRQLSNRYTQQSLCFSNSEGLNYLSNWYCLQHVCKKVQFSRRIFTCFSFPLDLEVSYLTFSWQLALLLLLGSKQQRSSTSSSACNYTVSFYLFFKLSSLIYSGTLCSVMMEEKKTQSWPCGNIVAYLKREWHHCFNFFFFFLTNRYSYYFSTFRRWRCFSFYASGNWWLLVATLSFMIQMVPMWEFQDYQDHQGNQGTQDYMGQRDQKGPLVNKGWQDQKGWLDNLGHRDKTVSQMTIVENVLTHTQNNEKNLFCIQFINFEALIEKGKKLSTFHTGHSVLYKKPCCDIC